MSSFTLALVTFFVLATYAGPVTAQSTVPAPLGTGAAKPMLTLQMPPIPDPVPVTLKPASTAVLVFDVVDPICASQPKCVKTMVPAISSLWHEREKLASLWDTGRERQQFRNGYRKSHPRRVT